MEQKAQHRSCPHEQGVWEPASIKGPLGVIPSPEGLLSEMINAEAKPTLSQIQPSSPQAAASAKGWPALRLPTLEGQGQQTPACGPTGAGPSAEAVSF